MALGVAILPLDVGLTVRRGNEDDDDVVYRKKVDSPTIFGVFASCNNAAATAADDPESNSNEPRD